MSTLLKVYMAYCVSVGYLNADYCATGVVALKLSWINPFRFKRNNNKQEAKNELSQVDLLDRLDVALNAQITSLSKLQITNWRRDWKIKEISNVLDTSGFNRPGYKWPGLLSDLDNILETNPDALNKNTEVIKIFKDVLNPKRLVSIEVIKIFKEILNFYTIYKNSLPTQEWQVDYRLPKYNKPFYIIDGKSVHDDKDLRYGYVNGGSFNQEIKDAYNRREKLWAKRREWYRGAEKIRKRLVTLIAHAKKSMNKIDISSSDKDKLQLALNTAKRIFDMHVNEISSEMWHELGLGNQVLVKLGK